MKAKILSITLVSLIIFSPYAKAQNAPTTQVIAKGSWELVTQDPTGKTLDGANFSAPADCKLVIQNGALKERVEANAYATALDVAKQNGVNQQVQDVFLSLEAEANVALGDFDRANCVQQ